MTLRTCSVSAACILQAQSAEFSHHHAVVELFTVIQHRSNYILICEHAAVSVVAAAAAAATTDSELRRSTNYANPVLVLYPAHAIATPHRVVRYYCLS